MKKFAGFILIFVYMLCITACSTPADINKHTEDEAKWAMIPMVRIDGVLYLDTGYNNTAIRECGTPDGEITSSVDGSKKPTADDQSNFGAGYGYQYGADEGTIEIYMNDKWRIFATEDVRQNIQFPDRNTESDSMSHAPDTVQG